MNIFIVILGRMTLNISKSINNNMTKRNLRQKHFWYKETTILKPMNILIDFYMQKLYTLSK